MWMLAGLLSYVIDCGFTPPDKVLFDRFCSSITLAMVDQNAYTSALQAFFVLQRRNLYLQHAPPTLTEGHKVRRMSSSPFGKELFEPQVLSEVTEEHKGDSAVTNQAAMNKFLSSFSLANTPSFKKKTPAVGNTQGPSPQGAIQAGSPLTDKNAFSGSGASGAARPYSRQKYRGKKGKGPMFPKGGGSKPAEPNQGFRK